MPKNKEIPFQDVIAALLDTTAPFPMEHYTRFSDLDKKDLHFLRLAWKQVDPLRRLSLLQNLAAIADVDLRKDFDSVALFALKDETGSVRAQAARMLGENDSMDLAHSLYDMVRQDPDPEARAAAASTLGKFVYLGELEEISEKTLHRIEDCLLAVTANDPDVLVRRCALEALGFSSRPEVPALISQAYADPDPDWVSSALFAMGRSYDERWEADVKRQLRSPNAEIQIQAVKAAGELGLGSCRRILLDLLEEEGTDVEIRAEVIWSLSNIGGEEVRGALNDRLEKTDDENESDLIEEALENLDLSEQISSMDLFDIDLEAEAHSAHVIDLSLQDDSDTEPPEQDGGADETPTPDKGKSRHRHKKS